MSVLERKRVKSQFETMNHFYKMRKQVTDCLLRDFGFSMKKAIAKINKQFQNRSYEQLNENEKARYKEMYEKDIAMDEWFIEDERRAILDCLRDIGQNIFSANDIMPQYREELTQRRIHQDEAIAKCNSLKQEMQFIIETLPVDINKYTGITLNIDEQIGLIKAWRKSDNRFKPIVAENEAKLSELREQKGKEIKQQNKEQKGNNDNEGVG